MSNILDTLGVFFLIFALVIGGTVAMFVIGTVTGSFNLPETDTFGDNFITGMSALDWAIPLFVILVMFLNFLTPFYEEKNPILFFAEIILYFLGLILTVPIQNFMISFFAQTNTFTTYYTTYFTKSLIVLNNLVLIWILAGAFYLLGGWAKVNI